MTSRCLMLPSRRNQLLAIAALIGLSWLIARLLSPLLTRWLRSRENWPKWRLRLGLQIERRLPLMVFAALAWAVVLVMREITWPSRSQVIALAATIAKQFFSGVPETQALIFALLAFAAGFAVRPFGAIVFGRITSASCFRCSTCCLICRHATTSCLPAVSRRRAVRG